MTGENGRGEILTERKKERREGGDVRQRVAERRKCRWACFYGRAGKI